jgi:5-hydroxyisourate hydrolase-like protein (transthyretin family)
MRRMQLGHPLLRLFASLVALGVAVGLAAPVHAQEPAPTSLTLTGERQRADADTLLRLALAYDDGTPVAGAQVLVERKVDGAWQQLAVLTTDEAGQAEQPATMQRDASDNRFRASYAGDPASAAAESGVVEVPLRRREGVVRVGGPDQVVDEQSVPVRVAWRTGNGTPVPGVVRVLRRDGREDWRLHRKVRLDEDGKAELTVTPRTDTRWKAVARRLDWVTGDTSRVHRIDNLPPGVPVKLPKAAPRPRINLPDQPHAVGEGANPVVRAIPDRVWNQMTGRTWHRGCPVGRAGLRYLRINYWDYRGYRRRGELVAAAGSVRAMAAALAEMYRRKLPIRAMYRVDRFGWSARVRGGDDYASMAAGNTSAFNCRDVVGNPGVRSPHSYGRSLDVNTWENPYRSRQGTVPNRWWMGHSHPRVAWRSSSHAVVEVMRRHGLRWTYGTGDTQHFDHSGGSGRAMTSLRYCDGCVSESR